jgi:hypothetical protein
MTPPRTMPPQNGLGVNAILRALKAMNDLHELGLVTCIYPEGSRGHAQVEEATTQAAQVLAGTRQYGHLYAGKGEDDGRTKSTSRRDAS